MNLNEYLAGKNASAFAELIKVPPPLLSQWRNGVRPIPAERCPAIERATNREVRCEDLRPDVDWAYLREAVAPEASTPAIEQTPA